MSRTGRDKGSAARGRRPGPGAADLRAAARALLRWFDPARRPMPWRGDRDPYRVWVSEVMLQQTTVGTAGPYFLRFVAAFPDVATLAAAAPDAVMKAWEGLGYYGRARNLHAAAKRIVERHGGVVPSGVDALSALPGIGRSTAGAVASLAYGRDEPVLDGNVRRVLSRLDGLREDPSGADAQRRLWELSRGIILPGKGRETALALMDLGNLVCAPRAPACPACPLEAFCRARREGTAREIPARRPKRAAPHRDVVVGVIEDGAGRVLIVRRPGKGLLGGLWSFPGGFREPGETLPDSLAREVRQDLGAAIEVGGKIGTVPHAYSHYRVTIHAYRCRPAGERPRGTASRRWVPVGRLGEFAFPASNIRIIERLAAGRVADAGESFRGPRAS